jgi:hypothetical protein
MCFNRGNGRESLGFSNRADMVSETSQSSDVISFVRIPDSDVDSTYLNNSAAAKRCFADWFARQSEIDVESFKQNLRQNHLITCLGDDLTRPQPYSRGHYCTTDVYPGQLRSEIAFSGQSNNLFVCFGNFHHYARNVSKATRVKIVPTPWRKVFLQIPGISKEALPYNIRSKHFYSDSGYIDDYLKAAVSKLTRIKGALLCHRGGSGGEVLRDLADYYYIMVNAHSFHTVNNSIIMNHINVILRELGHSEISHGYLDLLVMCFLMVDFRQIFLFHLQGRLPFPERIRFGLLGRVMVSCGLGMVVDKLSVLKRLLTFPEIPSDEH